VLVWQDAFWRTPHLALSSATCAAWDMLWFRWRGTHDDIYTSSALRTLPLYLPDPAFATLSASSVGRMAYVLLYVRCCLTGCAGRGAFDRAFMVKLDVCAGGDVWHSSPTFRRRLLHPRPCHFNVTSGAAATPDGRYTACLDAGSRRPPRPPHPTCPRRSSYLTDLILPPRACRAFCSRTRHTRTPRGRRRGVVCGRSIRTTF